MRIIKYPSKTDFEKLSKRPTFDFLELEEKVLAILNDVKSNGDEALKKYSQKFDNLEIENFLVSNQEIEEAVKRCEEPLKKAIQLAFDNIKKFHEAQKEEINYVETSLGVKCWRKMVGIQKVGLYIPAGLAPLFSTVLMLGIPAKIANCQEIILCSPANKDGKIDDAILYAASLVGVDKIFKVGGAQAIAAMAYGTKTIPKTYKIFGPGNQFVTCAKQLVNKEGIAIDMPAGPSELLVLADKTCIPKFVAADLLSQAEHGKDSQVILVSSDLEIINSVINELNQQLKSLPRQEIARISIENSLAILAKDSNEAIDFINEYAPEHLIIACENDEELGEKIVNAGSIFLGNYSCESAADYISGTNHTLPTNAHAKAYSGVSLDSFVKKITFQKISQQGMQNIGKEIEIMAEAEGLIAHKNAATFRMEK